MIRATLLLTSLLYLSFFSNAQCDYEEDFEGTLIDWQNIQGTNQITGTQAHSGSGGLEMDYPSNYARLLNSNTIFGYGTYTAWFYVTGPFSAAFFHFHYQDYDNQYYLGMQPQNTDNPNLILYKREQGQVSTLGSTPPIFGVNTWFKMTIERTADGFFNVYINDLLQFTAYDTTFSDPGHMMVMGYDETTFVDDICYEALDVSSITEQAGPERLIISPNPSSDGLFAVQFTDNNAMVSSSDIKVYNSLGESVEFNYNLNQIDISSQSKGIYFLHVELPNKDKIVEKIVLN